MTKYFSIFLFTLSLLFTSSARALAAPATPATPSAPTSNLTPSRGFMDTTMWSIVGMTSGISNDTEMGQTVSSPAMSQEKYIIGYNPSPDGTYAVSGITPKITDYVAIALTTPPVQLKEYVADLGSSIGLPGFKVEAQGIGYKALTPVLGMWKAFRNLAYSLYIIVFLVIGVMIMFRTKVNAQTIISIQNSLPNLLITLLIITFSYAIAGFIIDLIYLSMYLLVYIASASGLIHTPTTVVSNILNQNVFTMMISGKENIVKISAGAINDFVTTVAGGGVLAKGAGGILAGPLALVLIGLGVLVGMFKTLWQLIQSYFMIIAYTVMAPIQLLMNGIPGSKAFSSWIRNMVANAAVFPVVLAMLMFGSILTGAGSSKFASDSTSGNPFNVSSNQGYLQGGTSTSWIPPMLSFLDKGGGDIKSPGATTQETFMALLGVFIILMVPAAAQMTRDALKVENNKYTSEIGASVGQAYGMASYPFKAYYGAKQQERAARMQSKMLAGQINPPGMSRAPSAPGANSSE